MTTITRIIFQLFLIITYLITGNTMAQNYVDSVRNAEVYIKVNNVNEFIHGIVFDYEGNMFIGKDRNTILKVTPSKNISTYITLDSGNRGSRTHIWNIDIGPDSCLYAAAGDRIIKISKQKEVTTVDNISISGTFGALDIRFDNKGNFYCISDDKVYKYDASLNKTVFINGKGLFSEGTSLCFNNDYSSLYISDPPSNNIIKYSINGNGTAGEAHVIRTVYPHYIDIGMNNSIMCTPSTDNNGSYWLAENNIRKYITLDRKGGCTLKFGKKDFNERSLYILDFPNLIYKIDLSPSVTDPAGMKESSNEIDYLFEQNYLNPFNPKTVTSYAKGTSAIGTSQLPEAVMLSSGF